MASRDRGGLDKKTFRMLLPKRFVSTPLCLHLMCPPLNEPPSTCYQATTTFLPWRQTLPCCRQNRLGWVDNWSMKYRPNSFPDPSENWQEHAYRSSVILRICGPNIRLNPAEFEDPSNGRLYFSDDCSVQAITRKFLPQRGQILQNPLANVSLHISVWESESAWHALAHNLVTHTSSTMHKLANGFHISIHRIRETDSNFSVKPLGLCKKIMHDSRVITLLIANRGLQRVEKSATHGNASAYWGRQ